MTLLVISDWDATVATTAGALIGAVSNYVLQFHLTFRLQSGHRQAIPAYVGVTLVSGLTNTGVFFFLHSGVDYQPVTAQVLTTLMVAHFNFLVYKKVVFYERCIENVAS